MSRILRLVTVDIPLSEKGRPMPDVTDNVRSSVDAYPRTAREERNRLIANAGHDVHSLSRLLSTPVWVVQRWLDSDDPAKEFKDAETDLQVKPGFLEVAAQQARVERNASQLWAEREREQALEAVVTEEVARRAAERLGDYRETVEADGHAVSVDNEKDSK